MIDVAAKLLEMARELTRQAEQIHDEAHTLVPPRSDMTLFDAMKALQLSGVSTGEAEVHLSWNRYGGEPKVEVEFVLWDFDRKEAGLQKFRGNNLAATVNVLKSSRAAEAMPEPEDAVAVAEKAADLAPIPF